MSGSSAIRAENLQKVYPGSPPVTALRSANLDIADNEFFTLLGPSGCGKTTLLRLIAGFEAISRGSLHLFNEDISRLPPEHRPVNTVFQHYSLFPHLSVLENVGFGLRRLGKSGAEADRTALEMLDLVQLGEFGERMPNQLSGGQQQRVALARALAPHPEVLLLDEPLSALDLKLRQTMRLELKRLQRETGITFVFVTHDQEEALAMSDRIAVMSAGEIQQVGTPDEIYEFPANRFVADFIGDANFFEAMLQESDGSKAQYLLPGGAVIDGPVQAGIRPGDEVTVFFRPNKIRLTDKQSPRKGIVRNLVYLGDVTDYRIEIDKGDLVTARVNNARDGSPVAEIGESIGMQLDVSAVRVLTK